MDASPDGWVIDGNYERKIDHLVTDAADIVVWLDLPLWTLLRRLWRRTSQRIRGNVELWNGNRESWRTALWGRESLFVWTIRAFVRHRREWPRRLARHPGFVHCERIGGEVIGYDHIHVRANVLADVLRQCAGLRIFSMEEAEIAAALTDADHNFFRFLASVNTPSDLFAAYVGFIYFNRAVQFRRGRLLNSVTNSVAQVPCCAIVDSEHSLKLVCRDSLARLAHDVGPKEPFSQRQVRIVKDRASRNGELIAA